MQGYFISRPKPLFLDSIAADVKDEIIKTNLESRPKGIKKIYTARNNTEEIDLLRLALEKYTDIHIYQSKLTIVGDPDKPVKMNISVMDNHSCELTLRNVNIESNSDKPTIYIGEYARLVLNICDSNKLNYSGIYVPMGSQLEINGSGNLLIDCCTSSETGIGIGCDFEQSYGDITVDMQGSLEIICDSVNTICIGGGFNHDGSEINLMSGKIKISMYAHNGLAVGSFNGDSDIKISENCSIDMTISGIKVVGIGSCSGISSITTSADTSISCSGAKAVAVGVLDKGEGNILISKGRMNIKMRSASHTAIGTRNGKINTMIADSEIMIDAEGNECAGIGDISGGGKISIKDSAINLNILAATPKDIGTNDDDVQIHNSVINSVVNKKLVPHVSE
jgi:hypothetical protein